MENKKKWLVIVTETQYTWLKEVAEKTSLKGSDIIGELLNKGMEDRQFVASLAEAQLKIKLQKLNDKAMEIEEQREELQKQFGFSGARKKMVV